MYAGWFWQAGRSRTDVQRIRCPSQQLQEERRAACPKLILFAPFVGAEMDGVVHPGTPSIDLAGRAEPQTQLPLPYQGVGHVNHLLWPWRIPAVPDSCRLLQRNRLRAPGATSVPAALAEGGGKPRGRAFAHGSRPPLRTACREEPLLPRGRSWADVLLFTGSAHVAGTPCCTIAGRPAPPSGSSGGTAPSLRALPSL